MTQVTCPNNHLYRWDVRCIHLGSIHSTRSLIEVHSRLHNLLRGDHKAFLLLLLWTLKRTAVANRFPKSCTHCSPVLVHKSRTSTNYQSISFIHTQAWLNLQFSRCCRLTSVCNTYFPCFSQQICKPLIANTFGHPTMHIGLLPDPRCYAVTLDLCGAVRYRTTQVFQVPPVPALPLFMRKCSL
jgi:hypothetical protein